MIERFSKGPYLVSTDPRRLDPKAAHAYLSTSYWAKGRTLSTQARAMRNSLCFGLYRGREQIGLARVITDYATFAYLGDVYVKPEEQGKGLGTWLVACVLRSRALKALPGMCLRTRDAHGLYRKFGFAADRRSNRWMRLRRRR